MQYLSGAIHPDWTQGFMLSPNMGNRPDLSTTAWAADNGAFASTWDETRWLAFLARHQADAGSCLFAVAPDVVGDAAATLDRSRPYFATIRALGYKVAYVLQDGQEQVEVPWDEIDAIFIGGSTEFKLSDTARALTAEAKRRGLWVHMGRVNSLRRMSLAASWGVDSADGTYLAFGPSVNLPRLQSWVAQVNAQPALAVAA